MVYTLLDHINGTMEYRNLATVRGGSVCSSELPMTRTLLWFSKTLPRNKGTLLILSPSHLIVCSFARLLVRSFVRSFVQNYHFEVQFTREYISFGDNESRLKTAAGRISLEVKA